MLTLNRKIETIADFVCISKENALDRSFLAEESRSAWGYDRGGILDDTSRFLLFVLYKGCFHF